MGLIWLGAALEFKTFPRPRVKFGPPDMCSGTEYERLLMDGLTAWAPKLGVGTCKKHVHPWMDPVLQIQASLRRSLLSVCKWPPHVGKTRHGLMRMSITSRHFSSYSPNRINYSLCRHFQHHFPLFFSHSRKHIWMQGNNSGFIKFVWIWGKQNP